MTIELHIGAIVIEGASLTRSEREELRAFVRHELAVGLTASTDNPSDQAVGRAGAAPTESAAAHSPRVSAIGQGITRSVMAAVSGSLPPTTRGGRQPQSHRGGHR